MNGKKEMVIHQRQALVFGMIMKILMNFHRKQMKLYEVRNLTKTLIYFIFLFNLETRRIERERKLREHQQRKFEKEASRTVTHKRDSFS